MIFERSDLERVVKAADARMLIAGERVGSRSGRTLASENPTTEEVVAEIPEADEQDLDLAVGGAARAAKEWRRVDFDQRAKLLERIALILEEHADTLGLLDTIEAGLPIGGTIGDVHSSIPLMRYFAGLGTEMKGASAWGFPNEAQYAVREPYGVVGRITPYNHPLKFTAWSIAAPLMAGNAVIIKPPEVASLSSLHLATLIHEVVPPGLINILTGGREIGAAIAAHPGIPRISAVGSVPMGQAVMAAGARSVKDVSLELGGKNPLIILPDVDVETASSAAAIGMNLTRTHGQSCGSMSRLIVHESKAQEIAQATATKMEELTLGDPWNDANNMGPLAFRSHYERVLDYISVAKQQGATMITGGGRPAHLDRGYFIAPTIFTGVTPNMRIAKEEIFGPVVSVITYRDREEAIAIANGVDYGLSASVYTNDLAASQEIVRDLDAGQVWVNGVGRRPLGVPFGGFKSSGLGKEGNLGELLSYTREKSVLLRWKP